MGDTGPDEPSSWQGSRPSSGHMVYQPMREDEPSSSVPSSSSASFLQSVYRGQGIFQNSNRYAADSYDVQGASVSSQMYQVAESSYQPSQQDSEQQQQFGDLATAGNEAQVQVAGYSSMENDSDGYGNGQSVASSSVCDTGYPVHQLIVDAQNRIVAVQRVISPDVDSTVSQSANGVQIPRQQVAETASSDPRSLLAQPSTSGTSLLRMRQSQSEVSTSGESSAQVRRSLYHRDSGEIGQGHGEVEAEQSSSVRSARRGFEVMESAVSSITGSSSNEAEVTHRIPVKHERRSIDDIVSGEPDTTQTDEEEGYQGIEKDYGDDSSSIDDRDDLSSDMLPLENQQQPSSSNNVVDSTQMMAIRLPVSQSGLPAVSNLPTSFMQVNVTNGYPEQIQATSQAQLAANELPLSQFTTSELAASASQLVSSMESQLNTTNYILNSSVDTSSRIDSSDIGTQFSSYVSSRGLAVDSSGMEPQAGTSSSSDSFQNRRKSSRIAGLDNEFPSLKKPVYESKPYNPKQLWCEECMQGYDIECEQHRLLPIQDKVVFSRAWASLPQCLQIFRIEDDNNDLGVFSKRSIIKRTQFGPFVAELVDSEDKVTNRKFPLMVERDDTTLYLETSDENMCNWMMFVRPAESFAEQNLVAYQHGSEIYFTVTKDITEPKTELKVWYAAHYAERWNKPCHVATEEDLQAMEEQLCKFHCYECPKRFKSAAGLQRHLIAHDSDPLKTSTVEEPSSSELMSPPRQRKRKPFASQTGLRKKLLAAKKYKESGSAENSGSSPAIFHWKKRSTNIYLNKTLKKYQKWHGGDAFRKSAYSQSQKFEAPEDSASELGCVSCDIVFSNPTLLNMHMLSHNEEELDDSKFAFQLESMGLQVGTSSQIQVDCPGCSRQFFNKRDLIHHVVEHGAPKSTASYGNQDYHSDIMNSSSSPSRQHRCGVCFKSFTTLDRLAKHHQCHGDEADKPFQCNVCFKRFINNSAMSCHMKIHSTAKYYQCPICQLGFDQTSAMREHSLIHANANGSFNCPHCDKVFLEFLVLKKHVRGFHTNRTYPCTVCEKVFPRPDKLRLHMLRHSSVRDFMCDTCGRQFKRKDKLKEHIKRMHSADREEKDRLKAMKPVSKKFIPKVSPTEYHRFIYKCHLCLLGFKRRGMLVNHIAKRHPDLKPESVPELNLPILKTQRDYYCQYCDKVYKSSSKRKAHILKNHPGSELPQSARKKSNIDEIPGVPNPTYSQTVGSITTMPHQCEHCHKQYASKAKLLQHQRKHHPEMMPHLQERLKREALHHLPQNVGQSGETATYVVERCDEVQDSQAADLLTQAMSELTQSVDFRQISGGQGSEQAYLTRLGQGTPTMVQIQTSGGQGTQTIELTHLSQALQHFAPPQGHLPIQVQVSTGVDGQIALPITTSQAGPSAGSATHIVTVDPVPSAEVSPQQNTTQPQQLNFPPISIVSGAYLPKSWTYPYKSH